MGQAETELLARFKAAKAGDDKQSFVEAIERILRALVVEVPSNLREQLDYLRMLNVLEPLLEGMPSSKRKEKAGAIAAALSELNKRIVALFEDQRNLFDLTIRVASTSQERELARAVRKGELLASIADLVGRFAETEPLPTKLDNGQFQMATQLWKLLSGREPHIETVDGEPCGHYLEFMQAALSYADFPDKTTFKALASRYYRLMESEARSATSENS